MTPQSHSWPYTWRKHLLKKILHPYVFAALFTIVKTWKQPKYPLTDEWTKKMWYMYTMEYYSAIKKTNNAICKNLDRTRNTQTKSEQERQKSYDITYIWNLIYDTK